MRVHILGTGAMACLFGARLSRVAEVTLLGTWKEGIAAIETNGIVVEDEGGVQKLPARAFEIGTRVEPADLVLVLVKAWQTDRVAPEIPPLLSAGGPILTLQNGLGNVEKLGPRAHLGVTAMGATLWGPGRVRPGGECATYIAGPVFLMDLFCAAGLETHALDEAGAASLAWGKLAVNAGINAVTAIFDIPNGELLSRPDARALMESAAEETAAVARANSIALPFRDAAEEARRVARATASNVSSMLQDVRRGAPTEIEAINGAVAREGAHAGVPVPVNETLWRLLAARDAA